MRPLDPAARLSAWVERLWWRAAPPPAWLGPLSAAYGWVSARHLAARDRRAVDPPLPLISVGNITVGGSGKTPFVLALARALTARGLRPVILCRGDGGRLTKPMVVTATSDPALAGDEACMMAQAVAAPVVAGRDRVAGAMLAAQQGDLLLLDDGLQYRLLRRVAGRSCEIVLIPAAGLGNGALLPAGPLREPPAALARADLLVVSGTTTRPDFPWLPEGVPCVPWAAPLAGLRDATGLEQEPPRRVALVTGIARPERVARALAAIGVEVAERHTFPDHHRYRQAEVAALCRGPLPVATTAKDGVKLRRLWPNDRPLWLAEQRLGLDGALVERVLRHIGLARDDRTERTG